MPTNKETWKLEHDNNFLKMEINKLEGMLYRLMSYINDNQDHPTRIAGLDGDVVYWWFRYMENNKCMR